MIEISNSVIKLREILNLTQVELGEYLGVTDAYIGYLESGKRSPSQAIAQKFVDLCIKNKIKVELSYENKKIIDGIYIVKPT